MNNIEIFYDRPRDHKNFTFFFLRLYIIEAFNLKQAIKHHVYIKHQNRVYADITRRLNLDITCCHAVKDILPSRLQSTNIRVKFTELHFCLLFCMGVKFGLSH
jgi:hypothetical protein